MFKIKAENLPALFRKIAAEQELYLPVKEAGQVNFAAWSENAESENAEVSLDTLKTVKSPKDAFFPQSENLYSCVKDGKKISIEPGALKEQNFVLFGMKACDIQGVKVLDNVFLSEPVDTCVKDGKKISIEPGALKEQNFVLFGMKACDIQGVKVLDNVFLSEPVDTFYAARRDHGTIVALACHEPEESCFCKVFGIDCADPVADVAAWMIEGELYAARRDHGTIVALACHEPEESCFCKVFGIDCADPVADVAAWMIEGELYWKALSEKGEALTAIVKELLTDADEAKVEEEKQVIRTIVDKLPYSNLSLEGWGEEDYMERFNSSVWEELYKPCLACGTCTFVCPTCQCYDIKDYDTGHGVQRYRCWDSCMYSDFTMMAHGNNRNSQMQRFRQRFMHKLVYYPVNNNGMFSCVGCGRCVEKCPSALNIVKVIKAFEKQGGEN